MATNPTELDVIRIKENIKEHLRGQTEFTDFDFEGAAMTVLIDTLAVATHYMGTYANMSFSELFLDSARLRNNVVSHAKTVGYTPRQSSAAVANITLSIQNPSGGESAIEIPRGTAFTATVDNVTYDFVTTQSYSLTDDGNGLYAKDIEIKNGAYQTAYRQFDESNPIPIVLLQDNIDTDYMVVKVKPNKNSFEEFNHTFVFADSITKLSGADDVYFIQENRDGNVEVYFGDGILGRKLDHGNFVSIQYLTTDGSRANACDGFELVGGIAGDTTTYGANLFNITTNSKAAGGTEVESIASIKHLAPKVYKAQKRAVTADDYKTILLDKYGWIQTLNVWGGEDHVPQTFGRVFMAIKPDYGLTLTDSVKEQILSYLKTFRMVGITPVIIDPSFIHVNASIKLYYDGEKIGWDTTANDLEIVVAKDVKNFIESSVTTTFDTSLGFSTLLNVVDNAHTAIQNNETSLTISMKFVPDTLNQYTYTFDFSNKLIPGSFTSKTFGRNGTEYVLQDDKNGNVNLFANGTLDLSEKNKHTIDYATGRVVLQLFHANVDIGDQIELEATPVNQNISAARNTLIVEGTTTITSDIIR